MFKIINILISDGGYKLKRKIIIVSCMNVIVVIFSFNLFSVESYASPDPAGVEKIKSEAPLHIIGRVTSDELHQDLTEQKGNHYQIRKMNIRVEKILTVPKAESKLSILWSGNQDIIVLIGILTFAIMIVLFSLIKSNNKLRGNLKI
jgi:hypothetical protein